jgi:hypothetical protein
MTKTQIQLRLGEAGKIVARAQLDRYLRNFNIAPAGVRQRPQQYPADSAERILRHLGFPAVPPVPTRPQRRGGRAAGLVTMQQLKQERKK